MNINNIISLTIKPSKLPIYQQINGRIGELLYPLVGEYLGESKFSLRYEHIILNNEDRMNPSILFEYLPIDSLINPIFKNRLLHVVYWDD
jgi:hypothetical protein